MPEQSERTSQAEPRPAETVAVLGNGGWGSALALLALRNGHNVRIWGVDQEYVAETARTRQNPRYLPRIEFPTSILLTSDAHRACEGATLVVSAVPTQFIRKTVAAIGSAVPRAVPVVSVSKGLENGTLARPTEILAQSLAGGDPRRAIAALSGDRKSVV